ncbi:MAG: ATP-binding protein [Ruminococcus sp.]|nr:ATP-binding protein [Ruminococcus sp.]MDE6847792.1 ATP-binding protein [Ruminococcus sp.]MDE7137088.1 ATP-binding protein [Ruminococcus sp.]
MSVMTIFEKIAENAVRNNPVQDGDYMGSDGLIYCGKCHTPKQSWAPLPLSDKKWTAPVQCACRKAESKRLDELKEHEEAENRRRKCFVDDEMAEWCFANDDGRSDNHAMQVVRNYVDNFEKMNADGIGLFIYGDVGVGKSFAAACIANALIDRGVNAQMTDFTTIINDMWKNDDRNGYLRKLNDTKLLVIDDLGRERESGYTSEIVASVLDARCRSNRPLILTSNLTLNALMDDKNTDTALKRIYSRISKIIIPVEFKGVDRRKLQTGLNIAKYRDILGL